MPRARNADGVRGGAKSLHQTGEYFVVNVFFCSRFHAVSRRAREGPQNFAKIGFIEGLVGGGIDEKCLLCEHLSAHQVGGQYSGPAVAGGTDGVG